VNTAKLRPRHVVVTGAAGAIGAAIARALRARWGSRLALVDRVAAPMHALAAELDAVGPRRARPGTAPPTTTVHTADLTDLDALPALVDAIAAVEPIDGLVNCAGVMEVRALAEHAWSDAAALLAVDLLAPLRLQERVARALVDRGRAGAIVNIASMAGRVPLRGCAYYGAAKAGLAMASEIARAELAPHGIRVVTVYPGPVRSALERGARAGYGGGGVAGKLAPTGDAGVLARRIVAAIERDEPRVIYPRAYGIGWTAPNVSRWVALTYGPPPIAPPDAQPEDSRAAATPHAS
jgi:3-hydroxybutyrate dehydrogenase